MKYRALSFIALILSTSVIAQKEKKNNEFLLKGKVAGQDTGYIHIGYVNSFEQYIHDSCYLKNGVFEFRGSIAEPTVASLYGKRKSRSSDDPNSTEIFIEPATMQALLEINNFKKSNIIGSKTQDVFSVYNKQNDSLNKKWQNLWDDLANARAKKDEKKIETIYKGEMSLYREESNNLDYNFIKQFPGSPVSAYLLIPYTQELTIDSLKMIYSFFSQSVQQSRYGKKIGEFIVKAETVEIKKPAPDFTQADVNGNNIILSNFKGKYVLLDFWASWCIPCRAEHPFLKKAFSKFQRKGFTIIGVSLDEIEYKEAWLEAIKKDELPWFQLCDFKGWKGSIVNQYNLFGKGIPANFLINPEGLIIAKDLRGDELEKKLAELIK